MIKIEGDIGWDYNENDFYRDVIKENSNDILIEIDSYGGYVDTALSIAKFIKESGKTFSVINSGDVMSSATLIFLACQNREFNPLSGDFLIHLPYFTIFDANSVETEQRLAQIKALDDKISGIYENVANNSEYSKDFFLEKMKLNAFLTEKEIEDFNFAKIVKTSEEKQKNKNKAKNDIFRAVARFENLNNENNNNKTNNANNNLKTNKMNKELQSAFDAFGAKMLNAIKSLRAKNFAVTTVAGQELNIEDIASLDDLKVGLVVTLNDAPAPDGEYKLANETTIVVAEGKISEIKEPAENDAAEEKIEELEEEIEKLEEEKQELEEEVEELEEKLEQAENNFKNLKKDFEKIKNLASGFVPKKDKRTEPKNDAGKQAFSFKRKS